MTQKEFVKLSRTNQEMPLVGYGTARISKEETAEAVYNAIKVGYRMIDGALIYGNEVETGQGINKAISEGIVRREDLFVINKLWNCYHNKDDVKKVMQLSLKRMGLSYIDLYLAHYSVADVYIDPNEAYPVEQCFKYYQIGRSPFHECWKAMESLVDEGLALNIGISNFNVQLIIDILTYCKYKPSVLEIEHHPYLQQKRLVDWVASQDIRVIAYASFGSTAFAGVFPNSLKHLPELLTHPVIKRIAEKHQQGANQVLLRWSVQRNIAVIPKTMSVDRMQSNRDIFSFELDSGDMETLESFECNARFADIVPEFLGIELPIFC